MRMCRWIIVGWALALSPFAFCQHAHINAGALGGVGSQLHFVNGGNFVTNSGFVLELPLSTNGPFAGLHTGSITFTALPATIFGGGPAFGHAQLGAYLELKTVSVSGPPGGAFGFWLEDEDFGSAQNIFTVPVGVTNGTSLFNLSESGGSPDSDPFGHIHGRRFTLTEKGLYTIGFQLVDTSANGPEGGPVHQPSDIFHLYMRAGAPEFRIHSIVHRPGGITIFVDTIRGHTYALERTPNLAGGNIVWSALGEPRSGDGARISFDDPDVSAPRRFYRLRITTP
ncbi:MAG TPA: hypothetical protein VEH27_04640 [Methylomirabilota bacterium]|nr:hypothetical protein [Methylomirabilota bacterium]